MASLIVYIFAIILASANALDGVKFFWYSPGKKPIEFTHENIPEVLPQIRNHRNVKILCHGWESNSDTAWLKPAVNNYMNLSTSEVITIDWGVYAAEIYPSAVQWTKSVGDHIGKTILDIHKAFNKPLNEFHLVGHSLGAHVMGFAGQYIKESSNQLIGRITGLDPAGPSFNNLTPERRLSIDDAYFVDIIHTNALILGFKTALGHIDFWPNGGRTQEGCGADFGCSHQRAPLYFAESIITNNYPAWYCDSLELFRQGKCFENLKIYMGESAPANIRGDFYLDTSPDGLGTN